MNELERRIVAAYSGKGWDEWQAGESAAAPVYRVILGMVRDDLTDRSAEIAAEEIR